MTAKPKRDSSGKFLPKWAGEMRDDILRLRQTCAAFAGKVEAEREIDRKDIGKLSERIGTSTPLIIWNIAVLIALAGLGVAVARLYGVWPY